MSGVCYTLKHNNMNEVRHVREKPFFKAHLHKKSSLVVDRETTILQNPTNVNYCSFRSDILFTVTDNKNSKAIVHSIDTVVTWPQLI